MTAPLRYEFYIFHLRHADDSVRFDVKKLQRITLANRIVVIVIIGRG